jgi:hypothetical protein
MASFILRNKNNKELFLDELEDKISFFLSRCQDSTKYAIIFETIYQNPDGLAADMEWKGLQIKKLGQELVDIYQNYVKTGKFISNQKIDKAGLSESEINKFDTLNKYEMESLWNFSIRINSIHEFDPESVLVYYSD